MRTIAPFLQRDLEKKMVLLSGPRQVGKTTLAKQLLGANGVSLNWDIRSDQRVIREQAWPKTASLIVLDEIHKFHKWKNFLKGVIDEFQNKPPLLVTGSARLDTFRKAGDALTGRTFFYHLHPIDLHESALFLPDMSATDRLNRLLESGGFPESFLNPLDSERLRNDRFDTVIQDDLRDLSKIGDLNAIQLLLELLRERVGGPINISHLAQDLSVSSPTVKAWIDVLERLFLVFRLTPYAGSLKRSLQKESKLYFFDCGASQINDPSQNEGARFENAVACSLLKFCDFQKDIFGKKYQLHYFRDREGREVDFIVTLNRRPVWCIETKLSDDRLSSSLAYIHERFQPKLSVQLVKNLNRSLDVRGIKIRSAAEWLSEIYPLG